MLIVTSGVPRAGRGHEIARLDRERARAPGDRRRDARELELDARRFGRGLVGRTVASSDFADVTATSYSWRVMYSRFEQRLQPLLLRARVLELRLVARERGQRLVVLRLESRAGRSGTAPAPL